MIDFLQKTKKIKLSDGQDVILYRAGIGYWYRLVDAMTRSYLGKGLDTVADAEVHQFLQYFFDGKVKIYNKAILNEIIREVMQFNYLGANPDREDDGENNQNAMDAIEKDFEYVINYLTTLKGWTVEYVCTKIDNVQLFKLLWWAKRERAVNVQDLAMAAQGTKVDEYIREIQGIVTVDY